MKRITVIVLTLCFAGTLCHAQSNIFVGLNGSVAVPCHWAMYDPNYSSILKSNGAGALLEFGLDFAYPLGRNFAFGFYASGGPGLGGFVYDRKLSSGSSDIKVIRKMFFGGEFKCGILMLAGDLNHRPFIIGLSPGSGYIGLSTVEGGSDDYYADGLPVEFRFGMVVTDHLYFTGNLNVALFSGGDYDPIGILTPSITVGYHFGNKFRTRR